MSLAPIAWLAIWLIAVAITLASWRAHKRSCRQRSADAYEWSIYWRQRWLELSHELSHPAVDRNRYQEILAEAEIAAKQLGIYEERARYWAQLG